MGQGAVLAPQSGWAMRRSSFSHTASLLSSSLASRVRICTAAHGRPQSRRGLGHLACLWGQVARLLG